MWFPYPAEPVVRPLTLSDQLALEAELLGMFALHGRPVTVADLFESFEPKWATAAANRLLVLGHLRDVGDGRFEVTASGHIAHRRHAATVQRPQPPVRPLDLQPRKRVSYGT